MKYILGYYVLFISITMFIGLSAGRSYEMAAYVFRFNLYYIAISLPLLFGVYFLKKNAYAIYLIVLLGSINFIAYFIYNENLFNSNRFVILLVSYLITIVSFLFSFVFSNKIIKWYKSLPK